LWWFRKVLTASRPEIVLTASVIQVPTKVRIETGSIEESA